MTVGLNFLPGHRCVFDGALCTSLTQYACCFKEMGLKGKQFQLPFVSVFLSFSKDPGGFLASDAFIWHQEVHYTDQKMGKTGKKMTFKGGIHT